MFAIDVVRGRLAAETLFDIFKFCDYRSLCAMAQVNRFTRNFIEDERLWAPFLTQHQSETAVALAKRHGLHTNKQKFAFFYQRAQLYKKQIAEGLACECNLVRPDIPWVEFAKAGALSDQAVEINYHTYETPNVGRSAVIIRADSKFDISAEKMFEVLWDLERMPEWDPTILRCSLIGYIDDRSGLVEVELPFLSVRCVRSRLTKEDGQMIIGVSYDIPSNATDDDGNPVKNGISDAQMEILNAQPALSDLRSVTEAKMQPGCTVVRPVSASQCEVSYYSEVIYNQPITARMLYGICASKAMHAKTLRNRVRTVDKQKGSWTDHFSHIPETDRTSPSPP